MVLEELCQEARREVPALVGVRRPHRGDLRHDQALDELARETVVLQPLSEARVVLAFFDQGPRMPVEAREVGDHAVKPGRDQMRALGEQAVGGGARVLEVPADIAHAEAHARRLPGDAEVLQQPLEVRVVAVIEDDETGVHVQRLVCSVDPHGVGVAAGVLARLEDRDLVMLVEQIGDHQTGDACADDCDPHRGRRCRRWEIIGWSAGRSREVMRAELANGSQAFDSGGLASSGRLFDAPQGELRLGSKASESVSAYASAYVPRELERRLDMAPGVWGKAAR